MYRLIFETASLFVYTRYCYGLSRYVPRHPVQKPYWHLGYRLVFLVLNDLEANNTLNIILIEGLSEFIDVP